VINDAVERADIGPADAVVADPSRAGLGRAGANAVARTAAHTIALVSCDPAAFARDARLLCDLGYRLERVVPVDQFGHTSHIEVVSSFRQARPTTSRARRPH
jgi:23S rRNA (uracil1939-C5)-methyltransferase